MLTRYSGENNNYVLPRHICVVKVQWKRGKGVVGTGFKSALRYRALSFRQQEPSFFKIQQLTLLLFQTPVETVTLTFLLSIV